MKLQILFIPFILTFFSCSINSQNDKTEITDSLLQEIAEDQLFVKMQNIEQEIKNNFILGKFKMENIDKVYRIENNVYKDICDYDLSFFSKDPDIKYYFELSCKHSQANTELLEKYPFLVNNVDAFKKIYIHFKKTNENFIKNRKKSDALLKQRLNNNH